MRIKAFELLALGGSFASIGPLTAVSLFAPSAQAQNRNMLPLILYYKENTNDNLTMTQTSIQQRGYRHANNEACILSRRESGTRALHLMWHPVRQDYVTVARPVSKGWQEESGYEDLGIEGYVFTSRRPGTIPLYLYWHAPREDNATVASQLAIKWQIDSGYEYAGVEGYVYPYSSQRCGPDVLE